MVGPAQFQKERAELEAVLHSGAFDRAPHLFHFLSYVCERYFEGRSDQIKEYTIGIEALGRAPGFDPKKDSIVRVEAFRLRKRLSDYYASTGAQHSIRIVIPNGQYAPQFITQNGVEQVEIRQAPPQPAASAMAAPAPIHPAIVQRRWLRFLAAPMLLAAVILIAWFGFAKSRRSLPERNEIWSGSWTAPVPAEFRMLAGYRGAPFADRQGHVWLPDAYFNGGHSVPLPAKRRVEGLSDPNHLRAERSGTFRYEIPLVKGIYEMHLYFVETEYGPGNPRGGGEATRIFGVSVNGVEKLHEFDPLAESGSPNRLHVRVFKDVSPASDGRLHLAFRAGTGPAFVNAIEILPAQTGLIRPIRIVAQDSPVTDAGGRFWSADEYVCGGTLVLRRNTVSGDPEKALYRGERYGHFTYRIPLASGKYRLTLRFAETWFGTPESSQPTLGSRIFNVFMNGVALLENFEIGRQAGMNHALTEVFDNLEPNAQGLLTLEFVPVKNYAEVNAIEIIETS